jgi:uncharacterized protein (TIGR00299 family) protein
MSLLYVDAFSGASGDMFLGALLDLGVPAEKITEGLKTLPIEGWNLKVRREKRHHIWGTRVEVGIETEGHSHRTHGEIRNMIASSLLHPEVKEKTLEAFSKLAQAEAKIHNLHPDEVAFHEIGALDSIVDIVGTFIALHLLGCHKVVSSPLPLGRGFVDTAHGSMPVPAPATLEILKGVPVYEGDSETELLTPTAAAILTVIAESFGPLPAMRPQRIGYGVGSRDLVERPNLLRLIVGEEDLPGLVREDWILEANIDDMNPQLCEHLMERLLSCGALDVTWTPTIMKRGRPGGILKVLVSWERKEEILRTMLEESTTIGVRMYRVRRKCLERDVQRVETPWGPVTIKVSSDQGRVMNALPEYRDCEEIASRTGVPLKEVYFRALAAYYGSQEPRDKG